MQTDYKETKPQLLVEVDKTRAADLGVSIQSIGRTLQTMMSERRVTTYIDNGEEYDVILQASPEERRITSYNVCYTKLLRASIVSFNQPSKSRGG